MQFYIFADFHLGVSPERDKETSDKFFRILEELPEGATVVLLGDIFDFWFEYKTVLPKENFLFVSELYKYRNKFEFLYFCGNHDFWVKNFIPGFKIRVFQKERIFQIGDKKVLLAHGDFYYNKDPIGTFFNFVIRVNFIRTIFGMIHPDIGIKFAKLLSRISRNSSEKREVPEIIPPRAQKFFDKGGDICVLGHFHKPMFIEEGGKVYVNTGQFPVDETYVYLSEEKIALFKGKEILKEKYFR